MAQSRYNTIDVENLNKASKAPLIKPSAICRRPALDELKNKLDARKAVPEKPSTQATKPVLGLAKDRVSKPAPSSKENVKVDENASNIEENLTKVRADLRPRFGHGAARSYDPLLAEEYSDDIYQYLKEREKKVPVRKNFLVGHKCSVGMRGILVDWLVQVHSGFGLTLETLHLSISILDRYLQDNTEVGKESLQLIGAAALRVAAKYEEIYPPDLTEFVYICDNIYSAGKFRQAERDILRSLNFFFSPCSIHFLRRFSKLAMIPIEQHNLGKYLLELALVDSNMSHVRPSIQAAAAFCLTRVVFQSLLSVSSGWSSVLASNSGIKCADFKDLIPAFARLLLNATSLKLKAVFEKYSSSKFSKISQHPRVGGRLIKKLAGVEVAKKA